MRDFVMRDFVMREFVCEIFTGYLNCRLNNYALSIFEKELLQLVLNTVCLYCLYFNITSLKTIIVIIYKLHGGN